MCHGKAVSVLYSEFVSVAVVIQHATRMRRIIFSFGLPGSAVFPHYVKTARSENVFLIFSRTFV